MGQAELLSRLDALQAEVATLDAALRALAPDAAAAAAPAAQAPAAPKPAKAAPQVSPLAPAAFPALPPVAGVRFAAGEAGVRYKNRKDVMLAMLSPGSVVTGVFTRSATRSAPVLWCEALRDAPGVKGAQAIVVNSGNANAFTGRNGAEAVEAVAAATGAPKSGVWMASTGVIGEALPHERIAAKLDELNAALSEDAGEAAARAIMTTDTFPKGASEVLALDGAKVTIAGFAKGSGMIAPDMATMLGFVFTDAAIDRDLLRRMLAEASDRTFNAITVDSDTSTSDTVLVAATGRAAMDPIASKRDPRAAAFAAALERVLRDLAQQIVRDGEGATKLVAVTVTGAKSDRAAKKVGLAIANSPLVKTAIAGEDPNWGRIVMAVGKSGEAADRDLLSIRFGDITVAEAGWVSPGYKEADGAAYMKRQELEVTVDLGVGSGSATVWTCDLTKRYIEINADYRS
ncbi:MAG: bifunctional glutamate N-acetyltransferase/amino-acid acetyltransferase ArgJ [Pseudomonadota bacterium]|nr:bifunctional glutamate N-acetyltransferase/amino-acid acetyltransferase ArgJ [Pseudomonadota bacterium]